MEAPPALYLVTGKPESSSWEVSKLNLTFISLGLCLTCSSLRAFAPSRRPLSHPVTPPNRVSAGRGPVLSDLGKTLPCSELPLFSSVKWKQTPVSGWPLTGPLGGLQGFWMDV